MVFIVLSLSSEGLGGKIWPTDFGECIEDHAESKNDDTNKCHENDLEGLAIGVNKQTGIVEGMTAIHHTWVTKCELDVSLPNKAAVYSEPKGHALQCKIPSDYEDYGRMKYLYNGQPPQVPTQDTGYTNYGLRHIEELRIRPGSLVPYYDTFTQDHNHFQGDDYDDDAAATPWNNGVGPKLTRILKNNVLSTSSSPTYVGDLLTDPARVFAALFPQDNHISSYSANHNLDTVTQYSTNDGSWATTALGDATIYFPPDTITDTTTITMTYDVPADLSIDAVVSDTTLSLVSRPFSLQVRQPDGITPQYFNMPVDIQMFFSSEGVTNFYTPTLQIMQWQNGIWKPVSFGMDNSDPINLNLYGVIDSPGTFGLFGVLANNSKAYLPIIINGRRGFVEP